MEYSNAEKANMEEIEFNRRVDSYEKDELPPANIIVAGITGTGKSTLLNAVFGDELATTGTGRPVTDEIHEYEKENVPIRIWDTVGLELDSSKTKQSIESIRKTIADKSLNKADEFDRIHAIWYCISSEGRRYQGAELDFIKKLHSLGVPFIIVLTKCIGDEDEINDFVEEIHKINHSMGMDDIEVVQVIAKDYKLRGITIPAFGLDKLVEITVKKLPVLIKGGFVAAQRVSKLEKRTQCEVIMYGYVREAKEGFWDKIPIVNIFKANDRILKMFKEMSRIYNTYIPEENLQKILAGLEIDFKNVFNGLIVSFNGKYYKNVMNLLDIKKIEGFEVNIDNLKKSDSVAVMVAFYGYVYIASIEELWEESTENQLKNIEYIINRLVAKINKHLNINELKK